MVQFALGVILCVGMFTVQEQLQFIQNQELGYDDENVVIISAFRENADQLVEQFRNELKNYPKVENITAGTGERSKTNMVIDEETHPVFHTRIDESYLATFGIDLVDGRNFSEDIASDANGAMMLFRRETSYSV